MKKIYNILLLFASVFSFAQVNLLVETERNQRDYKENDEVVVNILLEISGRDMNQQTPLRMFDTSKFDVVASGSDQNTFVDSKTGFRVNRTHYQYVLRPKKPGKLKIGSASVIINEKLYYTEPFDIYVTESESRPVVAKDLHDVFLNVEIEEREVYINQPTVAVLRAYSRNFDNFRKVRNIQLPQQELVSIEQISSKKSEIEPAGNTASQILGVFLVYPEESGRLELAPAYAGLSGSKKKIHSNKVKLKVNSLPANAPAEYKNAVGVFDVSMDVEKEKAEVQKPLNVTLKVSGTGNFNNLTLPEILPSDDFKVFAPKISRNLKATAEGITGEVAIKYILIPNKSGNLEISTGRFSYFNPAENHYVELGSKSHLLEIATHEEILASKTTLERVNDYTNTVLERVDSPVLKTTTLKVDENSGFNWKTIWMNVGIIVLGLAGVLLFRRIKRNRTASGTPEHKTGSLGSVQETENELRAAHQVEIQDHIAYLKTMKNTPESELIFSSVAELDAEVQKQHGVSSSEELRAVIQQKYGDQLAEDYRLLQQKIQLERYVPVHTGESLQDLVETAVNFYSQISK